MEELLQSIKDGFSRYSNFEYFAFTLALIPLSLAAYIDFRSKRLPNPLIFAAFCLYGLQVILAFLFFNLKPETVLRSFFFAVLAGFGLALFRQFTAKGLGFGDVKLSFVFALYLSPVVWFLGLLAACLFSLIIFGLEFVFQKDFDPKKKFAFGPPLVFCFWLSKTSSFVLQTSGSFLRTGQ